MLTPNLMLNYCIWRLSGVEQRGTSTMRVLFQTIEWAAALYVLLRPGEIL